MALKMKENELKKNEEEILAKQNILSEEENKAVEQQSLWNLSDFLPKKPSEVDVKVIKEMFEASVDGEAYDQDKFGNTSDQQVLVQEQVIQ